MNIPLFPRSRRASHAVISSAAAAFDGTTTGYVQLVGDRAHFSQVVTRVSVRAQGATTAGQIKFAISPDDGTTLFVLPIGIAVTAVTPSAGTLPFEAKLDAQNDEKLAGGITLDPGESLWVGTHNAESFVVHAEHGEIGA